MYIAIYCFVDDTYLLTYISVRDIRSLNITYFSFFLTFTLRLAGITVVHSSVTSMIFLLGKISRGLLFLPSIKSIKF